MCPDRNSIGTATIRVLLLLVFIVVTSVQAALVLVFCGFAANSFVRWLYLRIAASRFFAGLRHKVNPDKDNFVPAAQHSASIAMDGAIVDEQNESVD